MEFTREITTAMSSILLSFANLNGAGMTSSGCQNPSLTYMALTVRACDHAVAAMNRGEL
jgi:hypothetical protein